MSDRAERRRQEREAKKNSQARVHQTIGTVQEQLNRHNATCLRCSSGVVAERGCSWLAKFYQKHSNELRAILNLPEPKPDPFEEYLYRKKTTATDQPTRYVEVDSSDGAE